MWFTPVAGAPSDPAARSVERYLGPSPWAGEEPVGEREPQAFLAIAGRAGGDVGVHFHSVDQFQYFVGGTCRFAGHPTSPGVVHYADHLRPYGPISPEGTGVTFLTFRGTSDHGAFYMPGAQPDLKEKREVRTTPGRNVSFDLASEPLTTTGGWTALVDEADGLYIGLAESQIGETVPHWTSGRRDTYAVVVTGGVDDRGAHIGPGSFRYLGPSDELVGLEASEDGTRVALLRLPEDHS